MYSLYRAWLMRDAVAAASLATPPDVVITVGSATADMQAEPRNYTYQFVAHRHLLSLHSGYLKSLLATESAVGPAHLTTIAVPSVTPDTFAPLLSFMYTGYLDLTSDNIYSVLLATHLLHMPRALDLCRAYLVHNQPELQRTNPQTQLFTFPPPPPVNPGIVKPIPSRKFHNFPHPFWSPVNVPPLLLHTTPNGPFRCVQTGEKLETAGEPEPVCPPCSPHSPHSPLPSTSKTDERPPSVQSRPSSGSPCPSNASFTSDERTVHVVKSPTRKPPRKRESRKINNENRAGTVLDVACCDGPVRFHRVLNESYGLGLDEIMDDPEGAGGPGKANQKTDQTAAAAATTASEKEYLDNYPKTQYLKLKSDEKFSNFMHQQMLNSNMYKKSKTTKGVIQLRKIVEKEVRRDRSPSHNENDSEQEDGEAAEAGDAEDGSDKIHTCLYCNHTFKSQYCFQKHARRHINPVDLGKETAANKSMIILRKVVSTTKQPDGKEQPGKEVRREVRLLDMNVQYYPCKTCGSKFPSYYFVHKHRKLCHSSEDNLEEDVQPATDHSDSSEAAKTKN